MTVCELIRQLQAAPPQAEVRVLCGADGETRPAEVLLSFDPQAFPTLAPDGRPTVLLR